MASDIIELRRKNIEALRTFLKDVEDRVKAITQGLSWSYEKLIEDTKRPLSSCSVHPDHRVRSTSIKEHEKRCQWLKDDYHEDDLPFSDYSGQGSCVVFTPELQERVIKNSCSAGNLSGDNNIRGVPQTSVRFDQDFSRNEKLALYDYVIANTKNQKLCCDLTSLVVKEEKVEKKAMTPLEIAAAERDAKRRRATYRNKVHTNRKTQTEILREVIECQMEALKEEILSSNDSRGKHFKGKFGGHSSDMEEHNNRSVNSQNENGEKHRSHKKHEHRDKHRDSKYSHDRDSKESKHRKYKKHKRSHSRSRSQERHNRKKSDSHSDYYGAHRNFSRH